MPKLSIRTLSLLASVVILGLYTVRQYVEKSLTPPQLAGTVLEPQAKIGDFKLATSSGAPFTKEQLLRKWTVLSLGFTHCPDVCPTTLAYFRDEINALPADTRKDVQFVFVSVDPERDTPERLESFVKSFHPEVIAVTGELTELNNLAAIFKAYFKKEAPMAEGLYNLAHSPQYFLINPEGQWQVLYTPPMGKGTLAIDLGQLHDRRGSM
ncbi:MAG: SCO family protein [Oligoflexus sp.]|jgi:protein SCO1/2